MKQQKLVSVSVDISEENMAEAVELPLQKYLNDGWRIESYQPVATHNSCTNAYAEAYIYVVVLLEKETASARRF